MHIVAGISSVVLLLTILWDAFETVILPRHVSRTFRLARLFFRAAWSLWSGVAQHISSSKARESCLSYFGPLSLLMLFGVWAASLVFAFALLQWAAGSGLHGWGPYSGFRTDLYFSGTTFFTLGLGDVSPLTMFARITAVAEAGMGFGFLAIIISYLPTLYGAFSRREVDISLLDARAGSPPTAAELLRRNGERSIKNGLVPYLRDWENWSAQLMETHLTYPVLCFFRSQHDNQSWLAAFAAILDVCALLIAYGEGETKSQAQLTFMISRHAVSDLAQTFQIPLLGPPINRLPPEDLPQVRSLLLKCGIPDCAAAPDAKLNELRKLYEPQLYSLSKLLLMPLPTWGVHPPPHRATIWDRVTSESVQTDPALVERDHL